MIDSAIWEPAGEVAAADCRHYRRRVQWNAWGQAFVECIDCRQTGPSMPDERSALSAASTAGPWPPIDTDALAEGFNAAVRSLRALADHWQAFGYVNPVALRALRDAADALPDWGCGERGHDNPSCLAHKVAGRGAP